MQEMWGWNDSERISYQILKCVSPWSYWDLCDIPNTENHKIAFKIEIPKSKMFRYKPKNVRAQSKKLAQNIFKKILF